MRGILVLLVVACVLVVYAWRFVPGVFPFWGTGGPSSGVVGGQTGAMLPERTAPEGDMSSKKAENVEHILCAGLVWATARPDPREVEVWRSPEPLPGPVMEAVPIEVPDDPGRAPSSEKPGVEEVPQVDYGRAGGG